MIGKLGINPTYFKDITGPALIQVGTKGKFSGKLVYHPAGFPLIDTPMQSAVINVYIDGYHYVDVTTDGNGYFEVMVDGSLNPGFHNITFKYGGDLLCNPAEYTRSFAVTYAPVPSIPLPSFSWDILWKIAGIVIAVFIAWFIIKKTR
jgi:hypothetical protein